MDFFSKIFDYIVDHNQKVSMKVVLILCGISSLFFVDWLFQFSDQYVITKKLQQIEKIESLLKNERPDSTTVAALNTIEYEVETRLTPMNHLSGFFGSLGIKTMRLIKFSTTKQSNANPSSSIRNEFWQIITASIDAILLICIGFYYLLFDKSQFGNSSEIFATVLQTAIFGFIGVLILSCIPVFSHAWYNYLLNAVINIVVLVYFVWRITPESDMPEPKGLPVNKRS